MTAPLWTFENVRLAGRLEDRLAGVTVTVRRGICAVIGDSGAGKTSLLNLMTGFERPDGGGVRFSPPGEGCLPIFAVPQDDGLWPGVTVRRHLELVRSGCRVGRAAQSIRNNTENVTEARPTDALSGTIAVTHPARQPVGGPRRDDPSEQWELHGAARPTRQLLGDFDLSPIAEARPDSLSRGEAGRVAVARAIASAASVLVMDEPLSHVDSTRRGVYWERLLAHCRAMETSLVFASHEPADVLRYSENVIVLRQGRVVYSGSTSRLYESPDDPELAAILGPMNWLPADEATFWGIDNGTAGPCVRPEWLSLENDEGSDLTVVESRGAGLFVETAVRQSQTERARTFVHRPTRGTLNPGTRVRAIIAGLLVICLLTGCFAGAGGPLLPVASSRAFVLPADGAQIPSPRDITAGPNGEWVVLDNAGRVLVYDAAGVLDRQWRMPEYEIGNPEGACVLTGGRIAVADTHYHRVVVFDRNGNVLTMFGEKGREPGQFIYPVAVVSDDEGNLYVAEYGGNDRIQKFSPEFEFISEFGSFGTGEGQFQRPSGMVWMDGFLYVVDAFNNRVHRFSDTGKNLGLLRIPAAQLHYPYDIALGAGGTLCIIEYGAGRLTVITPDGELVGRVQSTAKIRRPMRRPWGVGADEQGRIWVADTGNRRIVEIVPEGSPAAADEGGEGS